MVDYYEKQTNGNAFPRRPNFARRNLMERQKAIPAGYKVPSPRPFQYGSPSTYSSSYSYGYAPLHHPKPPARTAASAPPAGNNAAPTRVSSGRLRPSRSPAVTSLIDRLSRPTAASAAKRSRTAGWSEEGNRKTLDDFPWNNMDVFVDAHKAFYTPEGNVRAPTTSLSQEVD